MTNQVITLLAFGVLQVVFHSGHKVMRWQVFQVLASKHYLVWVFHPIVWETGHEFIAHVVVIMFIGH